METDIPKIRFLGSLAAAGGCVCNIHGELRLASDYDAMQNMEAIHTSHSGLDREQS